MGPKIALVGCGSWGKNLLRNFRDVDVLALTCDVSETGRAYSRQLAPEVPVTSDFEEVLEHAVPAIAIATPATTHYELARRALAAGKHVFVEKPLALRYEEGLDLVRRAREVGRILMVGHVLEYHPAIVRLKQIVHSGEVGTVQYVYSNRLNLGKIRREENILWSFAPHDISVVLSLIGELPFQVSATGGSYIQPNIPDTTVTHLLFNNGVRGHIYVSWLHPFKEQRLVVIGSRRMVVFDDVSKQLIMYDKRVDMGADGPIPVEEDEGREVEFSKEEPLRQECKAFVQAVRKNQAPLTDGESGLRVLEVLQAAQRSLSTEGVAVNLGFNTGQAAVRSSRSRAEDRYND